MKRLISSKTLGCQLPYDTGSSPGIAIDLQTRDLSPPRKNGNYGITFPIMLPPLPMTTFHWYCLQFSRNFPSPNCNQN